MDALIQNFDPLQAGLLVLGAVLGAVAFTRIILPLVYTLPRAASWALRGHLSWLLVIRYLLFLAFWCAVVVGGTYLLARLAPAAWRQLFATPLFHIGALLGIIVSALRTVGSSKGRKSLHDDFLETAKPLLRQVERAQDEKTVEDIHQPVWHVLRDGKRSGPFTLEELKRRSAKGRLKETDLLWKPGISGWVEASSVLGPVHKGPS